MKSRTRLIVFDLDGTLIDTMGGFADLAGGLLNKFYGWSFEEGRRRYLETSGIPFFQQLEVLLPGNDRNSAVAEQFEKQKIASFMDEKISEKTLETLHKLKDREIFTAISSNNFDSLVKEFVHRENVPINLALGFKPDFFKGRPHFSHMQTFFNVSSHEMIFIGDSLKDAQLATQNNIRFIAKIGTFSEFEFASLGRDRTVNAIYEIQEILDLLERL